MAANQNGSRRPGIVGWVNSKLGEEQGQLFKENKWRFWFLFAVGLQILNAALTWYFFPGNLGGILFCVGALLCWLFVAFMHYTDSGDKQIDHGVAILDSIGLIFAVIHFSILVWIVGHAAILASSETDYESKRVEFNKQIEKKNELALQKATLDTERVKSEERTARLNADAAYWGARTGTAGRARTTAKPAAKAGSTSGTDEQLESLEKPVRPEGETSAEFKARCDGTVRWLGAGELIIAVITLIYIRYFSVRANHGLGFRFSLPWRRRHEEAQSHQYPSEPDFTQRVAAGTEPRLSAEEINTATRLGISVPELREIRRRDAAMRLEDPSDPYPGEEVVREINSAGDWRDVPPSPGELRRQEWVFTDPRHPSNRGKAEDSGSDSPSLLDAEARKVAQHRENFDSGQNAANRRLSPVSAISPEGTNSAEPQNSANRRLSPVSPMTPERREGLKLLREHLRAIAAHHPGVWFKADLMNGGVMIRLFRRREGLEECLNTTHQSLKILDAVVQKPKGFRKALVDELIHQGFSIRPESANEGQGTERIKPPVPLRSGKDTSASADAST